MATLSHTKDGLLYFLSFRPKTTMLQPSNTHMVTSTVQQSSIQIFNTRLDWVETFMAFKHREKPTPLSNREMIRKEGSQPCPTFPLKRGWVKGLSD